MTLRAKLLRNTRSLLLTLLLGFLASLPVVHAQDSSQSGQQAEQQAASQQTADQENVDSSGAQAAAGQNEELILADTEQEEESPDRFIPTEEISQDLGVSFPVDI